MDASLNQKTGNGLDVAATQPAAGREAVRVVTPQIIALQEAVLQIVVPRIRSLRSAHTLILNRTWQFSRGVFPMPIFEYICKDCQHGFEALIFGQQKAECPKCHSKKLESQLSVFAVSAKSSGASQRSFSDAPAGACGSCGDPRGAGVCSMKN